VIVAWVLSVREERPAASNGAFQHERHALSEEHRFCSVPAEVRDLVEFSDPADCVERSSNHVSARARDRLDALRGVLEEPVCLSVRILKPLGDVLVEWKHERGRRDKGAGE